MKTVSTPFFEEMVKARQTYCSFCMRGSMPFLEDCEQCKIAKMFCAVQEIVEREMTPEERGSVEQTRDVYEGVDLPKELFDSIGKGSRTEKGFHASPVFRVFLTDKDTPDIEVQLVEAKTGFPDFQGTEDEVSSRSTVHYLVYLKDGVPSTIQIWDISTLKDELKHTFERIFKTRTYNLWGSQRDMDS